MQSQANYLAVYVQRSSSNASDADLAPPSVQRPQGLEKSLAALMKFIEAKVTLDTDPFWNEINNQVDELITEMANTQRVKPRKPKKKRARASPRRANNR